MMKRGNCETCNAKCCTELCLPIDTPETPEDYDDIRWMLLHVRVSIIAEDDFKSWYVQIDSPCSRRAQSRGQFRCAEYSTRPKLCRKYSTKGCEQTVQNEKEYGYDGHWHTGNDFHEWCLKNVKKWKKYIKRQYAKNTKAKTTKPLEKQSCSCDNQLQHRTVTPLTVDESDYRDLHDGCN